MIKRIKHIAKFLPVAIILVSCIEDFNRNYTGPTVAEFKNVYLERQFILTASRMAQVYPYVVTAENISLSSLTVRQLPATYTDSIRVQLVGRQSNQDIVLDYSIDATSTAVEGKSYQVNGTPGKITIPAGRSQGFIVLNVLNGLGAADPNRVSLVFNLTGNSSVQPSQNYKTFTYTITK